MYLLVIWVRKHHTRINQKGHLSSLREAGSARNARTIISRGERSATGARNPGLPRTSQENPHISSRLIPKKHPSNCIKTRKLFD
jgi:hypothetical protein